MANAISNKTCTSNAMDLTLAGSSGTEGGGLGETELLTCVRRKNKGISWGIRTDIGGKSSLEEQVKIVPGFMSISCADFGGCVAPSCRHSAEKSTVYYFGVFDGHGGCEVSNYCAVHLHELVAEEWQKGGDGDGWKKRWETAFIKAFERADDDLKDTELAPSSAGSTALVVVLSPCQIIASNCGDSRALLCRLTNAFPLTMDHKPDSRADEVGRIADQGGRILFSDGIKVEGILPLTRAIGDHYLKPWIIPTPEVSFMRRTEEDECLILASDGLWDVVSSELVGLFAPRLMKLHRRVSAVVCNSPSASQTVGDHLLQKALKSNHSDNVSIIVVDLKPPRKIRQNQ